MDSIEPKVLPVSKLGDFHEGQVLLVDKPLTWTSFDVVNKIRIHLNKEFGAKSLKVGHAGTLDPLATGLLIICTGKLTKRINEFQSQKKEYHGSFILGATTASYDAETPIENEYSTDGLSEKSIIKAAKKLTGSILQVPPLFSARKIGGERAYKKARRDEKVKLPPKEVIIEEFEISRIELPNVEFRVVCSTGTYIRSLVHDLGKNLNNGAYLNSLRRTRIGSFSVDDSLSLSELLQ